MMIEFLKWLIICLIVLLSIVLLVAQAEEKTAIVDCDYKPRQSDEVIITCGTLKGKGHVNIRLCGINYYVDVSC